MLSDFDLYDQNASAGFFDPEWMFGLQEGFDIVIGNPPYVRQEKIKDIKRILEKQYDVYNSTSDLYTYFYELTYKLLKEEGISCFITNNGWIRNKYGQKLRNLFLNKTEMLVLINFEDLRNFESAIVETNILIFKKRKSNNYSKIFYADDLPELARNQFLISQSLLKPETFTFQKSENLSLKAKIQANGIPLKEWELQINMGIKSGYNEAFYINHDRKNILSSQILKMQ